VAIARPSDLFDRVQEWSDIADFAATPGPGIMLGIVSGRRRQGKSVLLRRLAAATGGFYTMALEQEREPALRRLSSALARALDLPDGALVLPDWTTAWRTLLRPRGGGGPRVVVVDELPYLLRHSPELPSALQEVIDESRSDPSWPPVRLILCGSALAVMGQLLSGTQALRGRARLDLTVRAFDVRQTAEFWQVPDAETAFALHAVVGGTPGYRDLIGAGPAPGADGLAQWLAGSLLNPSHAMFREAEYLLTEDPRLTDRALYHSVLAGVSAGARTPTALGGLLGRPASSLEHPLNVLASAGYLRRDDDVLLQRRPRLRVSDPVLRFDQVVRRPRLAQLEDRRTAAAWNDALPAFRSAVLGPHFEDLARWWTGRHDGWPLPVGEVGSTVVNDRAGRSQHEVDVVALTAGQRRQARDAEVLVLGEAKAGDRTRGVGEVVRLERVRALLTSRGVAAERAVLAVFGQAGFTPELQALAETRADVVLVDLAAMLADPAL